MGQSGNARRLTLKPDEAKHVVLSPDRIRAVSFSPAAPKWCAEQEARGHDLGEAI